MLRFYLFLLLFYQILISNVVWANNYLVTKFFRSTIYIDDPFVTDKLILTNTRTESPTIGGDAWTINPELLYAKTIFKNLQASVTSSYLHIKNPGQNVQNGFDDWAVGLRYNFFESPQTASMLSLGFTTKIGGSGSHVVHAASHTTIMPEILFAQGFANLPNSIKYFKPFALFLAFSPEITTNNYETTNINAGLAIEYSLLFLQEYVTHFNSTFMKQLVPIVEFPFNICTEGGCQSKITGTVNPGVIIYNNYGQFGMEAIIPANNNTGSKVGFIIQLHLYLDQLFPTSLGRPMF